VNPKFPKILTLVFVAIVSIVPTISAWAADYLPISVSATDTVAGYPSALRTSIMDPNQDIRFVVEKPDGAVVQIPAQADLEGVAKADFYGHQTKLAGKYRVTAVYPGSSVSTAPTYFMVYPDQVSASQSSLRSATPMAKAGDSAFIVATLYDQYRNPIPDHLVKLVSSRAEDRIQPMQNGSTDQNGRANFKVLAPYAGVSVFSAFDTTVNSVLDDRLEVVFYQPSPQSGLSGLLKADIGQGTTEPLPGPVDHFDIDGLPASATVGKELSMTVVAKDKSDNVAKAYTGTLHFATLTDDNATLPSDYTMKDTDQGRFTFPLSLIFTQAGKQSVMVMDSKDVKITGEKEIEITVPGATGPASSTLSIKSPTDGEQRASSTVTISGQGKPNINLEVYVDDAKVDVAQTDSDGFFTYDVKNLDSSTHTFYVMSTDDKEVSKPVAVTIDTVPPALSSFEMNPQGAVKPGETILVTVRSEPKLESAKVRLQGSEIALTESGTELGKYEGSVAAPDAEGSYPVDVVLTDVLGNKADLTAKGTLTIQKPAVVLPPKVEGLQAEPGDSSIHLTWNPVTAAAQPIQKYKISYGTSLTELNQSAETDSPVNAWDLIVLENGVQYFMNVKAVDAVGQESAEPSVTLAATPVAPAPIETVSLLPVATPQDGAVTLTWDAQPGILAYSYRILIGVAPGQYLDSVTTVGNQTSATVSDLINNGTYYFTISPLGLDGKPIGSLYQEVSAIPSGYGFRPSASQPLPSDFGGGAVMPSNVYPTQLGKVPSTQKTGPETLWILASSVLFAGFITHHKRKILNSK
jgi:hypothetical protein